MSRFDENVAMVSIVAKALGPFRSQVVFVGGTVAGLLLNIANRSTVRPTDDVDVVIECTSYGRYADILESLRKLGFEHDMHGPLCRLKIHGVTVDVMPTEENILGFNNRWYPMAINTDTPYPLPDGSEIRIINAPLFLCTKLDAFADRGKGDFFGSSDIEDVIALISGRTELVNECKDAAPEIRQYLSDYFRQFLSNEDFLNALPGLLPHIFSNREKLVLSKIEELANISSGP